MQPDRQADTDCSRLYTLLQMRVQRRPKGQTLALVGRRDGQGMARLGWASLSRLRQGRNRQAARLSSNPGDVISGERHCDTARGTGPGNSIQLAQAESAGNAATPLAAMRQTRVLESRDSACCHRVSTELRSVVGHCCFHIAGRCAHAWRFGAAGAQDLSRD